MHNAWLNLPREEDETFGRWSSITVSPAETQFKLHKSGSSGVGFRLLSNIRTLDNHGRVYIHIYMERAFQFRYLSLSDLCVSSVVATIIQNLWYLYLQCNIFVNEYYNIHCFGIFYRATFCAIIEFVDVRAGTPTRHRGARSDRELGREIRRQGVQSTARGTAARGAGGRGATGTVAGFEDREVFGAKVAFAVSSSIGMAVSHRDSCISREQQGESFLSISELILS